jgi:hypothetical protein
MSMAWCSENVMCDLGFVMGSCFKRIYILFSFLCVNQSSVRYVCPNVIGTASEPAQACGCQGHEPRLSKSLYALFCGSCPFLVSLKECNFLFFFALSRYSFYMIFTTFACVGSA